MTSLERLLLNRISVHFVNKWFTWRKAPIDWNARCRARQVGGYQLISFLFSSTFSVFLWMDSLEFQIFGVQFCLFFVTWKSYANLLVEIAELTEIPLIPSFSNFRLITNQCLKITKKIKKKIPVFSFSCPVGNWYSVRDVSRGLCIVEIRPADQPQTDSRSSCPPVDIYCVIFLPFTCATIFLSNLKCWIHSFENWNNVKVARTATIYWLWTPCSTQVPRYNLWIFIG